MKNESNSKNFLPTKFGSDTLTKKTPLGEYPRPQARRDSYLCLNGRWKCSITTAVGDSKYDGEILVPFSPESLLSGVIKTVEPGDTLKYGTEFDIPKAFIDDITLLHFGAVDYECTVWLNGSHVGSHTGGYTAFTLDVTDSVKTGANVITVTVKDPTDSGVQARGKQKLKKGGIWYTPQSGIWQTVWLESLPSCYVKDLTLTPDIDAKTLTVRLELGGIQDALSAAQKSASIPSDFKDRCALIEAYDGDSLLASARLKDGTAELKLPEFECWTPENPKLYDLKITAGKDVLSSYFAMRKFSVDLDERGVKRLFLNNKPYFHKGVLDQGYWSDGLMTPPSDEAMIYDITLMKELGFNMLRKHIKIEPTRWYYHCDRIGMLVWQDMVCGGGKYNFVTVAVLSFLGVQRKDSHYGLFGRQDKVGREEFESDCAATVKQLKNTPCIAMWVPFNEGWGQFDSARITAMIKSLDPTRTVDGVSGWVDQGKNITEIKSLHIYFRAVKLPKDTRLILLSEFGGYSLKIPEHVYDTEHEFGYKKFKTQAEFEAAYSALIEREILPAIKDGLSAIVYTQLSDVEQEINGFVTFDRAVEKADRLVIKNANDAIIL
jgi:beta-galactosidase/beta-glucuronidase